MRIILELYYHFITALFSFSFYDLNKCFYKGVEIKNALYKFQNKIDKIIIAADMGQFMKQHCLHLCPAGAFCGQIDTEWFNLLGTSVMTRPT